MKNDRFIKLAGAAVTAAVKCIATVNEAVYKTASLPHCLDCFHPESLKKQKSRLRITDRSNYSTDLEINKDCDLNILSTTDFHMRYRANYNAGGSLPFGDIKTTYFLMRNIKELKPDIVVLTGDILLNESKFKNLLDICAFSFMMNSAGVYWAYTLGNHEVQADKSLYKYLIVKLMSSGRYALTKPGKKELFGYGNYTVNVKNSDATLRQTLFMFDSGNHTLEEQNILHGIDSKTGGYDYLKNNQIDFYKAETDRLVSLYGKAPSFMYMHIPLTEYELFFDGGNSVFNYNGTGKLLYGRQYEGVGCARYNSGMFKAIKEKGQTSAVFVGHDHINDWCVLYDGVYLAYNQPGGYNAYELGTACGHPESDWQCGVTLTRVKPDGAFTITPYFNSRFFRH